MTDKPTKIEDGNPHAPERQAACIFCRKGAPLREDRPEHEWYDDSTDAVYRATCAFDVADPKPTKITDETEVGKLQIPAGFRIDEDAPDWNGSIYASDLHDEYRERLEKWDQFIGGEAPDRMEQRASIISDALGIIDESTTHQVEAIAALRSRLEAAEELAERITLGLAAIEEDAGSLDLAPICRGVDILRTALARWKEGKK